MTLNEIYAEWEKDSVIDTTDPGRESSRIPQLHHKYYRMLSQERMIAKKLDADGKILMRDVYEYFNGDIAKETLDERKWTPNPKIILKTNISMYVDSHSDVIAHNLKVATQHEKIDLLLDIIKNLNNRNFQIKNMIDWYRFTNVPG